MAEETAPRGRGRLLANKRKKEEESLAASVVTTKECPKVDLPPPPVSIPPKVSGRAAALLKLKARLKEAGKPGLVEEAAEAGPSKISKEKGSEEATEKEEKLYLDVEKLSVTETKTFSFAGSLGKPLQVTANYIRLNLQKDRGVFEYEVNFTPEVDSKSNRFQMINKILKEMDTVHLFDGGSLILFPSLLFPTSPQIFKTELPSNPDEKIQVKFIFKKKVPAHQCVRVYNLLFKRIMNVLMYNKMGRNYFNPDHKKSVTQHKLDILPGYAVTVDEMEGGVLLCLDTQHRVVRTQNVYEYLRELRSTSSSNFVHDFRENIIGAIVITKYNNKTYRVTDIDWEKTPKTTFERKDSTHITFAEYYKNSYNIEIQDLNQPLLISRVTKNVGEEKVEVMICLIPELSYLTGLSDAMRSDYKVMKDVAMFTRLNPNQRLQNLREYINRVKNNEKCREILAAWGLTIDDDTLLLNGRCFEPQNIIFGENFKFTGVDWSNPSTKRQALTPIDINSWIIFHTPKDTKNTQNLAEIMVKFGRIMGCYIEKPQLVTVRDDRSDAYSTAITKNLRSGLQVLVFVLPNLRASLYQTIKKQCCCTNPIASQVVLSKTLSNPKKMQTIISKIALQINCKLGGSLWKVEIPAKGYMIIGIDVYHGGKDGVTICGFTASLNRDFTKWFSEALKQDKELGNVYRNTFKKALDLYYREYNTFPEKIFVYRDGIGDGQLDAVQKFEIPQFTQLLDELDIKAGFSFIVVQKRISTRIFRLVGNSAENPSAGTVVDTIITRRNYYDFFLVPQTVNQGTVNPTHYIVLLNTGDVKPDILQKLSFKLCHLYYNWSGTIRVPAPCQYSHKLAAMVGQTLQRLPSSELSTVLWYL